MKTSLYQWICPWIGFFSLITVILHFISQTPKIIVQLYVFLLPPNSLPLPVSPEYEIISPYEVSHHGVYISHEVAHHQRRRRRRSLTPDVASSNTGGGGGGNETVHFRLSGLGQDFHMELREASESLIAPGFTIQVLGKNGTQSLRAHHRDDLCFYQGSLRSRVNSSVALSTCMGMVSLNVNGVELQKRVDELELEWCACQYNQLESLFVLHCYFSVVLAALRLIYRTNAVIALTDKRGNWEAGLILGSH